MPKSFIAKVPYDASHPPVLAVYCSDGRFTDAVEELAQHLGHERIDTLTLPGGPGLLNRWSADYLESDVVSRAAHFLIKGHDIAEVLLLAHEGCGYYKARHGALGAEFIAEQQLKDLQEAAAELVKAYPGLTVHTYRVRPEGEKIHFEPISST
ncbi:carbonic anhydrase [Hyalangium rubrum]|uniref:Carbonic anhydrase n=1 Tax=Hyalangium rubrum TaxID=3103134 RepID=A0ABU5H143_9BACT|nr:carbonic anhydrase [Hyalangium sp. s54d21]MDY7226482.1 carbonic anhydrase [Hyalangium sp. s54d21]